jgi:23S rRNA pseudouridine2605 synthase
MSRRKAEEAISAGRVRVDGEVARVGHRVDSTQALIEIDGLPVPTRPGLVHYLVNKPRGVVSTASDPQGRPTVIGLVPSEPRVFPVGRLDADTEGLMVVTNDGELAHRLTHPSFGVAKEYIARVRGRPGPAAIRALREGVELEDGITAPAKANLAAPDTVRLVIHEGRNRQVRRMCEAVGYPVIRLVRTRIGPVADRSLAPGAWRLLELEEVRQLVAAARVRKPSRASRNAPPASVGQG